MGFGFTPLREKLIIVWKSLRKDHTGRSGRMVVPEDEIREKIIALVKAYIV